MTLTTILIGIALAIIFALSNAFSYGRGQAEGYRQGAEDAVHSEITKTGDKSYSVTIFYRE